MPAQSLLDRLERRFGHLAIPGLLRIVAGFQALCFVLILVNREFIHFLALDPEGLKRGEIWRLFTFAFVPQTTSALWIFFAILILLMITDRIEAEWGKFRLNLYFFATLATQWIAALLFDSPSTPDTLYCALFFVFAALEPSKTFMLYFVIPFKAKWLAWLLAAWMGYAFANVPPLRASIGLGMLPFLAFFLPGLLKQAKQDAKTRVRRAEYQANSLEPTEFFHQCAVCKRTDAAHPELEFRIASDGEEYCREHLPGAPGRAQA